MKCTCEQAAREARKAALEEAAALHDDKVTTYLWAGLNRDAATHKEWARRIRALANTPEKADG